METNIVIFVNYYSASVSIVIFLLPAKVIIFMGRLLSNYSPTSLIRPPFIRISLLSGRDLAKIFFLCVYNNYGEKGEFQSSQEFLQQNDFILLKTRL